MLVLLPEMLTAFVRGILQVSRQLISSGIPPPCVVCTGLSNILGPVLSPEKFSNVEAFFFLALITSHVNIRANLEFNLLYYRDCIFTVSEVSQKS